MPEEPRGGKGGTAKSEVRTMTTISKQRLSEFRKLAKIPDLEFRKRMDNLKECEEKIIYSKILFGDWYQHSDSIEWETPQWLLSIGWEF